VALFKVRLLRRDRQTVNEKNFKAIRNYEALEMAEHLAAIDNRCTGYELWRGERQIARRFRRQEAAD
jgi:hypothetical protein